VTAFTAAIACAVAAALAVPAAAAAVAAGAPAVAEAPAVAAWQPARQITSPDGLAISVSGISCAAPGDCTAAGMYEGILSYYQPPVYEGFVIDQRAGVWGGIKPIPGLLALNVGGTVTITAPSCPSPGNCAVGGTYTNGKSDVRAFVASERNGTWGKAQPIPGLAALAAGGSDTVSQVSCGAPGDCAATGTYDTGVGADPTEPFLVTETRGTWGKATEGPRYGITQIAGDVTCAGPGDCVLFDTSASAAESFVVEEKNGAWGKATLLPGAGSSDLSSLSCTSPGNCLAGGDYLGGTLTSSQAAVWRESDGTWSAARLLPGVAAAAGDGSAVTLVSCPSPTSCAAAGWYDNAKGYAVPFAISETHGTWAAPASLAGLAGIVINSYSVNLTVTSLSCGAPGDCTAGGYYANGDPRQGWAFLANETGVTWSKARRVPGVPAGPGLVVGPSYDVPAIDSVVTDVSCTTGGFCGATGDDVETYNGKAYQAGFLVNRAVQAPTTTVLRLSASRVVDGREQSEKLTITVTPRYGGTPAGTVTVRAAGSATACVITLKTRTASCTLAARRLGPGTYHLVARYAGSALDGGSASAAKNLTIEK
jgi:hypothetical protein